MTDIAPFDFRNGPRALILSDMNKLSLPLTLLLLTACTDSHATGDTGLSGDTGLATSDVTTERDAPIIVDGGRLDGGAACRLTDVVTSPPSVGEGCFCDGPFVLRGELVYRLSFALEVIDVSDLSAPVLVTSVPQQASYSLDIAIVGDVLFTAGGALERFDLTESRAPVSMGLIELGGSVTAMAVDGASMVLAIRRDDATHAILAIDASDPRALVMGEPIEVDTREATALVVRGDVAFAVLTDESAEASVVSLDLLEGVVLDTIARRTGSGNLAAIVDHAGHLFVSDLSEGVTLIDARDPGALIDRGLVPLETEYVFSLGLSEERLVVMGSGIWLYDATDPRALAPLGHAELASDRGHATLLRGVDGSETLLTSGGNGLSVIPLVCD